MFIKRSFNSIGDSLKMSRWFFGITSYGDARWGRSLMHSNSIKCCNRSSCEDVPRVPLFLPTKNIVLKEKLFSFSLSYFDYLRHLRFFWFYFLIGTLNELKLKFKIGCGSFRINSKNGLQDNLLSLIFYIRIYTWLLSYIRLKIGHFKITFRIFLVRQLLYPGVPK